MLQFTHSTILLFAKMQCSDGQSLLWVQANRSK